MTFGERLKLLRKEKKFSQETLGEKIGVARTSVANYETDRNYPTSEVLEKLSDVFNVSIDYLLGKSNIRNIAEEFEFAYHKDTEGLSDEDIKEALRIYKEIKKNITKNEEKK